jgi:hypothetical protein
VGTVYAKLAAEPTVYATADNVVTQLTFDPQFLRDRHLAWVSPERVTAFTVEGPGSKLALKKDGQTWKLEQPVKTDADGDGVDSFLRALAGECRCQPISRERGS